MLNHKLCITLMFFITILIKLFFFVSFKRDVNFINRKLIFAQIERQLYIHYRVSICELKEIEYIFSLTNSHKC